MAAGGIHDQLGGGFARYSVDAGWLVPHFEKMLYDNALLARTYLRAYLETRPRALPRRRGRDLRLGAARRCAGPRAGSTRLSTPIPRASRASSTPGPRPRPRRRSTAPGSTSTEAAILAHLGIGERGQLDGRSVLHLPLGFGADAPAGLRRGQGGAARSARGSGSGPGLDDKRLCAWNALMLGSLAEIGAALDEPRYLDAARECADFILETMRDADGRLLRTYNGGEARLNAYLEDHAYLLEALPDPVRGDVRVALVRGGPRDRRRDDRPLRRPRERRLLHDLRRSRGADRPPQGPRRPSGPVRQLLRRRRPAPPRRPDRGGAHTRSRPAASSLLLAEPARSHPQGLTYLLAALDRYPSPTREVALIAPAGDAGGDRRLAAVGPRPLPARPGRWPAASRATRARRCSPTGPRSAARPAAYVCERFSCRAPVG